MKAAVRPCKSAIALLLVLVSAPAVCADLPFEGTKPAPEFPEGVEWLNTDKPLTIAGLKGKIVLLDFWTYCCINCMHIIPDLKKLEAKYGQELVVIGVHSAKFDNEKQTDNIRQAIQRYEIEHPVINDRDFKVWQSFGAKAWPTLILINPNGRVIGFHSGEGIYDLFDGVIGATVKHFDGKKEIDRRPLRFALERSKVPSSLFAYPGKIASDENGNRFAFTDSNHHRIIVATLDGEILEVIGDGEAGLLDGDFATARFFRPQGLCFDAEKNFLYVADTENHAIRKIDLKKRTVETLAGTAKQARAHNLEGNGREVALNSPWDVLLRGDTLYIAMAGAHQIWALDLATRDIRVHAGTARENILDGPLKEANLAQPSGLATDGARLYFADSEVSAARVADFAATGRVETLIGKGLFQFGDIDGKYPDARLQHCIGVGWHDGFLYVADTYNHKIRRLNPQTKELTTYVGTGKPGALDGDRLKARLNEPNGLCFAKGRLLIADSNNHLIRACDLKSGRVSTIVFKGIDKLRRNKAAGFVGEELKLKPVVLSTRTEELSFAVILPKGTKLNPGAKSFVTAISSDSKIVKVGAATKDVTERKVVLPITVAAGDTTVTFDVDLYYCSNGNEGLCYFKSARLIVPVQVGDSGASEPTVEYRVER